MKKSFLLPIICILIWGCEKNIQDKPNSQIQPKEKEEKLILGKEINDPYAIHNMQSAYCSLKSKGLKSDIKISPTHNYLRFLPKNEDELNLLKSDTSVMFFDFPLNYEVEMNGCYYHDPELPEDAITWQYAVLPLDYPLPNIQHEIIYQVVLPNNSEDGDELKNSSYSSFFDEVERESFRLTGCSNYIPEEGTGQKGIFKRYRPSGRIMVQDDEAKRLVPLRGARVQARWTTHIGVGITDDNGEFTVDARFLYKVNFGIKWERAHYDIRDGKLFQAWYNESGKSTRWYLNIDWGKSKQFAHIHLAAHHMFYENPFGIKPPNAASNKLKISYLDERGTGLSRGDLISLIGLSNIFIYGRYTNSGNLKESNRIFGTTVHELGHISHWNLGHNMHIQRCEGWIAESWATAIEHIYTKNYYKTYYDVDYDHEVGYQNWGVANSGGYTPIFIDLIDDSNQGGVDNPNVPNDRVMASHGYTLQYIQDNILLESYGLSSLKSQLKAKKPTNFSDSLIDDLLALYSSVNLSVK